MATATTQPVKGPNTVMTRCPRAWKAGRVTGSRLGRFALISCPEADGIRHVRLFTDETKRFQAYLQWKRSGCIVDGCYGQHDHPILTFDEGEMLAALVEASTEEE